MAAAVTWLFFSLISCILCQRMELIFSNRSRICRGAIYKSYTELKELEGCVVVLGNLQLFIETDTDFHDISFDVREVTEFLVVYRVKTLESIGQLFPYLARIRGVRLLNNFALIVFDNDQLKEIGLYSLIKIDRGGVIMWMLPQACFVDTIDWTSLVPNDRRVIAPNDRNVQCNILCTCSLNASYNRCWNNRKCQIFLDGSESNRCHDQCLGCRNTRPDVCSVCRYYTYNSNCVSQCPPNTILIPDNLYCITEEECRQLDRLVWNNTCVADCPIGYVKTHNQDNITCEVCANCHKTCSSLEILSIGSIEAAERCVYINGSLTIHLRAVHGATTALRTYMSQIEEVTDYVLIESSDSLISLDFLPSLRRIKGKRLKDNTYSLDINNNRNLKELFRANVTQNLKIDTGTIRFEMNPKLCIKKIDKAIKLLPIKTLPIEIHEGTNGYSGNCEDVAFNIELQRNNDTSMKVKFSPVKFKAYYSVLYARLPPGVQMLVLPESCSEFEWYSTDVPITRGQKFGIVDLSSLRLASTYLFCIELYDPEEKRLSRSNLYNFTTPLGIPEPPFITELVASSSYHVVLRWVDHIDYIQSLTHYELDVALIDISSTAQKGYTAVDYCNYKEYPYDTDYTRHALVQTPPPGYTKGCESMCGILSTVTPGAMTEEHFDVCDDVSIKCDNEEIIISSNTSFGKFVRTLVLKNINHQKNVFKVGRLAPFRDYKFRLRACINKTCSRSARGVVRTFLLKNADVPKSVNAYVDRSGYVFVKWESPNISNGPILSYSVEVMPQLNIKTLLPQSWCVPGNETHLMVKSVTASAYLVRVCTQTLALSRSCGDWLKITAFTESSEVSWVMGVVCGILINIASILLGWYLKRLRAPSDVVPLVDVSSSLPVESAAPSEMFSDFSDFMPYPIPVD